MDPVEVKPSVTDQTEAQNEDHNSKRELARWKLHAQDIIINLHT